MGIRDDSRLGSIFERRFFLLSLAAIFAFSLLFSRLWYLQIIRGEQFDSLATKNRTRFAEIEPQRGLILDRNGAILVDNRPSFQIVARRQEIDQVSEIIEIVAKASGRPVDEIQARWDQGKRLPPYRPVILIDDATWEEVEKVQSEGYRLEGIYTDIRPRRDYPFGDMAAHLFGHIGEISEDDLKKDTTNRYKGGDQVGKTGLEKELEPLLRGEKGVRRFEVDARGRSTRAQIAKESVSGDRIYLTIDKRLQEQAERGLAGRSGAAVALDCRTGEILAFTSSPRFSPDEFARGIATDRWKELSDDPFHPLQDKAIQGQYPPGSTFKIVTALAALSSGAASESTTVDCTGSFWYADHEYRCWKKKGHGVTDLKKAMRESCDVWFYKAGLEAGIDLISKTAFDLGLGKKTGIMLANEKGGLIPTREWKKRRFDTSWFNGETVIASIGQGFVLTTPLQLAVMTATFANGGTFYRPQLLKKIETYQGEPLVRVEPEVVLENKIDPRIHRAIDIGLEAVVNEEKGTGWMARLSGLRVAGKTGTAQVVRTKRDEDDKVMELPLHLRDHALFVAYAPVDDPEIAVAVVVENGEHGSTGAAPVAGRILSTYFDVPLVISQPDMGNNE